MLQKGKFIVLTAALLLILSACGKGDTPNKGVDDAAAVRDEVSQQSNAVESESEHQNSDNSNEIEEELEFDINPEDIEGSKLEDLIAAYEEVMTSVETPIVEGDFNGDGLLDVAVALENIESDDGEAKQRNLLVALGRDDGTYHFPEYFDNIIYKADEGGVLGDPFMGLSIDEEYGTFAVEHYGGSNWRWSSKYHIQYLEQGWCIVGYSGEWFNVFDDSAEYLEYDLTLGDAYYKVVDADGSYQEYFPSAPVFGEIELSAFNADDFSLFISELTTTAVE